MAVSNWKEPTEDSVDALMSTVVTTRVAQEENQRAEILSIVVSRVRGTIAAGGVTPLSKNTSEVPPEGLQHTIVLATALLMTSQPNMPGLIMRGDGGSETGFAYWIKRAEAWLQMVAEGTPVTYPTIPEDDSSASGIVRWGSDTVVVTDAA